MYFVLFGTVTCGTVDCAFVWTDTWLDFSRDLVPLAQNSSRVDKCGDCLLATTVLTPNFSKNRCPRPRSMWQPRSLKNSFDNKSGAPPGTTYTRSTPLTPAIPGFQCLIVAKTECHGRRKLDPLSTQAPSSCKHLFPFFESVLSNQEA